VSHPTYTGGLGFGFKWNMGWMHDTLAYFAKDPLHRQYHHHQLTFGLLYAWSENFILPLSHDEVVHEKGSLAAKMPGDGPRQLANLRALYGYMWSYPGKKLLFMGSEFAQWGEWNHEESLDWHLTTEPRHRGVQLLIADLNRLYRDQPALWSDSQPPSFQWLDADDSDDNVIAFLRLVPGTQEGLVCVCNFSAIARTGYRVGLPRPGAYREILNTDSGIYGGGNLGNLGQIEAQPFAWQGQPFSASIVLPPLATLWFEIPR
jgi:1,4-alpha-glucan branching enzyme